MSGKRVRHSRLRWYDHVKRWHHSWKLLEMQLPGKRKRGRAKRIHLDVVKEDMQDVGAEDSVFAWCLWSIRSDNPWWESRKKMKNCKSLIQTQRTVWPVNSADMRTNRQRRENNCGPHNSTNKVHVTRMDPELTKYILQKINANYISEQLKTNDILNKRKKIKCVGHIKNSTRADTLCNIVWPVC